MNPVLNHLLRKCIDLIPLDPEVKVVEEDPFFMMVKKEDESAAETIAEPEGVNATQNGNDIISYLIQK